MKPRLRKASECCLRRDMLTFEPVKMVNTNHSGIEAGQLLLQPEAPGVQILELSNVNQLCDFH
eukprot:c43273_g1_i1 orf=2-187(-)